MFFLQDSLFSFADGTRGLNHESGCCASAVLPTRRVARTLMIPRTLPPPIVTMACARGVRLLKLIRAPLARGQSTKRLCCCGYLKVKIRLRFVSGCDFLALLPQSDRGRGHLRQIPRRQLVNDAARTVMRHRNGILRWFTSKLANCLIEGINSLVQADKAITY
jgi:transposase